MMMGMPPIVTMRFDNCDGTNGEITKNFNYINTCNKYGFKPWIGLFINSVPASYIPTLKSFIDNGLATSAPHAFAVDNFIYFNHYGLTTFDPAANCAVARNFYNQNQLKISNYFIPHYYELNSACVPELVKMGCEFTGIQMPPNNSYSTSPWLNAGPYRINRFGGDIDARPVYYGGYYEINGVSFFNCLTEIRDDGGYEWFPDYHVSSTAARGIRQLRRSLNSMVLTTLFTHEEYIDQFTAETWDQILKLVSSGISGYQPIYTTMDYAMLYIRAKLSVKITDVLDSPAKIVVHYSADNDVDTKCYLFTEQNGSISSVLINIPHIQGNSIVNINK
jgi:hypothetical protein